MALAPNARNPFSGRTYVVSKCPIKGRWMLSVAYDGEPPHRLDWKDSRAAALVAARLLAGRSYPVVLG